MKTINGVIHNNEFRLEKLNSLGVVRKSSISELKDSICTMFSSFLIIYWTLYFVSEFIA